VKKVPSIVWAFVAAAFVSNIGTHMQSFSEQWLVVLQSGHEAARWAGRIYAASGIGVLIATPAGGWIADHWRRGRSLAWTQAGLALLALTMSGLAWKGALGLHGLVLFALCGGLFAGVMIPLQLSIVGSLQPGSASLFGMMQVQWNSSRILGPVAAAALFAIAGAAGNFALNALSFIPLILVILRLPDPPPKGESAPQGSYREALRALKAPALREVVTTAGLFGLFGWTLLVLSAVYGSRYLGLSEKGVAALVACFGLGAVVSGVAVAARRLGRDTRKGMFQGLLLFSLSLAAITWPGRYLSPAIMFVAGFGSGLTVTCLGSRVRELAPPELIGRVNALYAVAIVGLSTPGNIIAGETAQALGWAGPLRVMNAQAAILLLWWLWARTPPKANEAPSIPA
jgi:MFS family permease